jgi:hypothetical protein
MRRRVYNESGETWQQQVETLDQNLGEKASIFRDAAHSIAYKSCAELKRRRAFRPTSIIQNGF